MVFQALGCFQLTGILDKLQGGHVLLYIDLAKLGLSRDLFSPTGQGTGLYGGHSVERSWKLFWFI